MQENFDSVIMICLSSSILNRKTEKTANDIRYIEMFKDAYKKYLII